jgi:hypothetical protein
MNEYKDLVKIAESVSVWTPDGYYEAPTLIDKHKMPDENIAQQIYQASLRNPGQRILTSGEWHQVREIAHKTNPELEKNMIELGTGYERTCTILDYDHGELHLKDKYFDGFLIQIPEIILEEQYKIPIINIDDKGMVKSRHRWKMPLPIEPYHYVMEMPKIFDTFLNTIYGTENAREKYPYAHFGLGSRPDGVLKIPYGLIDLVRLWYNENDGYDQHSVIWGSLYSVFDTEKRGARAAVENYKK